MDQETCWRPIRTTRTCIERFVGWTSPTATPFCFVVRTKDCSSHMLNTQQAGPAAVWHNCSAVTPAEVLAENWRRGRTLSLRLTTRSLPSSRLTKAVTTGLLGRTEPMLPAVPEPETASEAVGSCTLYCQGSTNEVFTIHSRKQANVDATKASRARDEPLLAPLEACCTSCRE